MIENNSRYGPILEINDRTDRSNLCYFNDGHTDLTNDHNGILSCIQHDGWDFIGNITPLTLDIVGNVELMKKFYSLVSDINPTLFYTVELNKDNRFYHSHFLIDFKDNYACSKTLKSIIYNDPLLNMFIGPKTHKYHNTVEVKKYDYSLYGNKGCNYSYKEGNRIGLITF